MGTVTSPAPELRERHRRVAATLILLSLGIVVVAERDLAGRPSAQIRGPKPLWRIACANALGAIAYLRWGRRTPS
jgi:hypothetical protein